VIVDRPVFFDASGKRKRRSIWTLAVLLVVLVMGAVGLAATVVSIPRPRALDPGRERAQPRPIAEQVGRLRRDVSQWLPALARAPRTTPLAVGFYVPWDPDSRASLSAHVNELDWVIPTVGSIARSGDTLSAAPDPQFDRIITASARHPRVLPMIQNAANDHWDGAGMAALLASPARRGLLQRNIVALVTARHGSGVALDFEELPASAMRDYIRFIAELRAQCTPRGWPIAVAVAVNDKDWPLAAMAKVADKLMLMNYDEHSPGYAAGAIASQAWFVDNLEAALRQVPRDRAILAIGNYAYDWHGTTADTLTVAEAWLEARESDATPTFDPVSGNATFSYEEDGVTHHVWLLDAASAWNELRAGARAGVAGVALWRLGAEDPGVWAALRQYRSGSVPDLSRVSPGSLVAVDGNGELIHIDAVPSDGRRAIAVDRRGLIADERFAELPTPYQVRRGGDRPGMLALTFDDGPDGTYTPPILDILEAKHVPATFFVIGENAITHPALLSRIIADGSELGNHSYTHPNMAKVSPFGIRIELATTQRLVEAYTGRAMRLFRAPYFGDAEPTTADELVPATIAQDSGYLNVGLHVDPGDWQRPGVDAIVERTVAQVMSGNAETSRQIVLLHDGGGDRTETVAALPRIIDTLRARGFTFVPVSVLAGVSAESVMPQVKGTDLLAVRADVAVFLFGAAVLVAIKWLFFVAIALGIVRAVLMAGLALRAHARQPVPPPIDPARFVSVLIPAFNEARVIAGSVHRVLASSEVELEVIVIDDGSSDGTSDVVRNAFGDDRRVRLLTLANGGKARALNRALTFARGEVVIALDADTQFETTTVARLARWFADPAIGAVAGNAKVGNRVNLVTKWQATEYVTAQNLERRALTRFDAITVVPGAVGAWRRAALDAVGGYPTDTLAEDQDLTIAVQRAGWRVGYDIDAVAWTEAPETLRALGKQRFRWAFGTLQCLWKHRAILRTRKPLGLAVVGIPQAWLFQIVFAVISPLIDLALVISAVSTVVRVAQHGWAQTQSDVLRMLLYWLVFTAVDVVCGWIAYRLEPREKSFPAHRLITQRIVYRQLMYGVVIRAVTAALTGPWVGWGKLERTGRVAEQTT